MKKLLKDPMHSGKYDVCMLLPKSFQNDARVLKEARSLTNQNLKVVILSLKNQDESIIEDSKKELPCLTVREISLWSRRFNWRLFITIKVVEMWLRFAIEALRSGSRVYHAHDPSVLLPSLVAAKFGNGKLLYDCHELAIAMPGASSFKNRLVRLYERIFLYFVDRVIMSDGAFRANVFRNAHNYTGPIDYIYNFPMSVNLPTDRRDIRERLVIAQEDLVVGYTGNIGPFRGLDIAISSMTHWPENTHLVMIGGCSESYKHLLLQLAENYQVSSRVHFLPPVPPDDVSLWLSGANLALVLIQNAGLSYYGSAPTKMFEAIMARVPQVSSNFPEFRRVVLDNGIGPVGRLVDPADREEIGKTIRELLTDEIISNSYRKNADALAFNVYTWQSQEHLLVSLYNEMLGDSYHNTFSND